MTRKPTTAKKPRAKTPASSLPLGIGIGVVVVAAVIYFFVGRPDLVNPPSFPEGFGDEAFGPEDQANLPSVNEMIDKLKERLAETPDDIQGWALLGQSLMVMSRFDEGAEAYRQALSLAPDAAELHSALGEALLLAADGTVTGEAANAFDTALTLDPGDAIARFYLGDYSYQQGDFQGAFDRWLALFNDVPAETPWLNLLDQRIRRAAADLGIEAPGVLDEKRAEADAAAAAQQDPGQMSTEDQQAMIEGMVAGLAERLADEPGDLDGWMRLGRAYMVLGRTDDAADAYKNVVAGRPGDPEPLSLYLQARLTEMEEKGEPVSEAILKDLETLERLDAENTTALYYLGVAALQANDKAKAKAFWERLLALLPPDSQDARFVQDKIDQIGG